MSELSNETLMAYADGELQGDERRQVEACLRHDPTAAQIVEDLKKGRETIAQVYRGVANEPVPQHLIKAIMSAPVGKNSQGEGITVHAARTILQFPVQAQRPGWRIGKSRIAEIAIAASCATVIALGALWFWQGKPGRATDTAELARLQDGRLVATAELAMVLERAVGAGQSSVSQTKIVPVMTFASKSGRYCRQFEAHGADHMRQAGVACRNIDGQWHVELLVGPIAAIARDPSQYVPAGQNHSPELESFIDRVIDGAPLAADQEAALARNGWRPTR